MIEKLVNQISTVKRFYVLLPSHPEVTVEISRKENIAHHHYQKADKFYVLPKIYYYPTLAVNHDT